MNVQTPLPTKGLTAVLKITITNLVCASYQVSYLAVDFLVNSFLPLMDGSNVFCHMALQRKQPVGVVQNFENK